MTIPPDCPFNSGTCRNRPLHRRLPNGAPPKLRVYPIAPLARLSLAAAGWFS